MPTKEKTPKMDKKLKRAWLKALRGGDYAQGTGQLCKGQSFCCLGVLCEVMGVGYKGESAYPASTTLKKAKISSQQASLITPRCRK